MRWLATGVENYRTTVNIQTRITFIIIIRVWKIVHEIDFFWIVEVGYVREVIMHEQVTGESILLVVENCSLFCEITGISVVLVLNCLESNNSPVKVDYYYWNTCISIINLYDCRVNLHNLDYILKVVEQHSSVHRRIEQEMITTLV